MTITFMGKSLLYKNSSYRKLEQFSITNIDLISVRVLEMIKGNLSKEFTQVTYYIDE